MARASASAFGTWRTLRREGDVVEHRQVREQVELLEHHADLGADLLDVAQVVVELDAVDDDAAPWWTSSRLMQRMNVDLPEPDGPRITTTSRSLTSGRRPSAPGSRRTTS